MEIIKKCRNICLRIMDVIIIFIAYYVAQIIIEDNIFLSKEINKLVLSTSVIAAIIYGTILQKFKTYKNITRYENGNDYLIYVLACLISCALMSLLNIVSIQTITVTLRVNLIASLIIVTSIIGYRVVIRMILTEGYTKKTNNINKKNILIIGAGEATKILLNTLKGSLNDTYNVVGLIDDNANKIDYAISGKKILGTRFDIPRICKENNVEAIFFTISNISNRERRKILEICQETGCKVRILPGTKELIKNKPIMENFRNIEIEDLLGRDTIKLDNKNIGKLIKNKVVLVTGGGGSIGSELCRQIAANNHKI